MHDRIPPSLAWLVKRRKAIAGQILLAERRREAAHKEGLELLEREQQRQLTHIRVLKNQLAAVDETMRLHEIGIDPEALAATNIQTNVRRSGYGAITRAIYAALGEGSGRAKTTDEVAARVLSDCDFGDAPEPYHVIRHKVRHRLQALATEGKVVRLHARYGAEIGLWCQIPRDGSAIPVVQGRSIRA